MTTKSVYSLFSLLSNGTYVSGILPIGSVVPTQWGNFKVVSTSVVVEPLVKDEPPYC